MSRPSLRNLSIVTVLLATSALTTGCAEALGLNGLTFEEEATGAAEPGPGWGGAFPAQDEPAKGPATWPGDLVVTARGRHVATFEPATGLLRLFHVDNLHEPDSVHLLDLEELTPTQLQFVPWPEAADQLPILTYDEAGVMKLHTPPFVDYELAGERDEGSAGIDELTVLSHDSEPILASYDAQTGNTRLSPAILRPSQGLVVSQDWGLGWDRIEPVAQRGFLKFDFDAGRVAFERFTMLGEETTEAWSSALPGQWSHAQVVIDSGKEFVLLYADDSGRVLQVPFGEQGLSSPEPGSDEYWPSGLTTIEGPLFAAELVVLTYNQHSGLANLRPVLSLESSVVR